MKSGCRSCALAAASSSALEINHRKITHTSTSRWAMPMRSSAPTALRYSASIRAWAHTKLIRQIVLTVTGLPTEQRAYEQKGRRPCTAHRDLCKAPSEDRSTRQQIVFVTKLVLEVNRSAA